MTEFTTLLQQGNAWFFIPSAILLGALHGLEPGHSKTMMAAFIIAIKGTIKQAVMLGLAATISHTAVVWLIAFGGMVISKRWINYQQFIQTLEKAITQHRQQLNQWTQKVDIALNSWREKKQRLQAWQTLQERQSTAALLAENRLDQKKMDEFAQRAAMRKPE